MSKPQLFKIQVQSPKDLSKFYTVWVTYDELQLFWSWYRSEIKAKRKEALK